MPIVCSRCGRAVAPDHAACLACGQPRDTLPDGWYLNGRGRSFGPLTEEELRGYFAAGMVRPVDTVAAPDASVPLTAAAAARRLGLPPMPEPPPAPVPAVPRVAAVAGAPLPRLPDGDADAFAPTAPRLPDPADFIVEPDRSLGAGAVAAWLAVLLVVQFAIASR